MTAGNRAGKAFAAAALLFAADSARALSIDVATAVRMSLDRSADLLSLEDQVSAAVFSLKLGLRDYFPQLSLGYIDSTNIVTGGPDASSIQWTVTVRQPLFDGGRSRRQRRLAEADILLQRRAIKDKKREIIEAVDSAYHRVLMLERKLALQKDTLAITDQELEIARAQYGLGSIREIDLMESELQRSSLDISILSSEADLEESEFNLRQLLGLRSDAALVLVDDFDAGYGGMDLPADPRLLEALVLEGNLELGQRQAELRRKLAAIIEAKAWYLPKVSLEGSLSLSGGRYPLQSASMNGKLMFEIPAPTTPLSFSVSMGGSTNKQRANGSSVDLNPLQEISSFAEIAEAAKEYGIMRQRIDDMGGALVFQVKKGVATYIKDKISLELQRGDLGLRRKTAEIQKRLLEIGGATRVDYLKTLNQRAEEESAILESVLKLRQSERALERLLGLDTGELERVRASIAATRN
jgi:outer membrane protein TolC